MTLPLVADSAGRDYTVVFRCELRPFRGHQCYDGRMHRGWPHWYEGKTDKDRGSAGRMGGKKGELVADSAPRNENTSQT